MRTALSVVLVAVLAALTGFAVVALGFLNTKTDLPLILCTAGLWLLFGAAFFAIRRVRMRTAIAIILIGTAVIGGAAMAGPPNTSTDSARYAWDGIVQNNGISPYEYVPVDDALAHLRTQWLFPTVHTDADGTHRCLPPRTHLTASIPSDRVLCIAINRATVPTIYPAMAEIYFVAVRAITGPAPAYWPLQLAGLLISLAVTVMLMLALRRRRMDPRWAVLWGWCPLVASEGITNSHVDMLSVLFIVAATLLVSRGLRFRGGIALGAAIATKLIPVVAAPALLRKEPWKVIVAAVATFAVLYVPYVIATGVRVIGYLPGYLSEEGYDNGTRFTLLSFFLPSSATLPVAAVLLLSTAVLVWLKTNPQKPWLGQVVMIGTTLLIVSPRYPWYALMLIPFIALTGRWEWFAVPLALTIRQLIPNHSISQLALGIAVVVIVACALYRTGPGGRERLIRPLRRART